MGSVPPAETSDWKPPGSAKEEPASVTPWHLSDINSLQPAQISTARHTLNSASAADAVPVWMLSPATVPPPVVQPPVSDHESAQPRIPKKSVGKLGKDGLKFHPEKPGEFTRKLTPNSAASGDQIVKKRATKKPQSVQSVQSALNESENEKLRRHKLGTTKRKREKDSEVPNDSLALRRSAKPSRHSATPDLDANGIPIVFKNPFEEDKAGNAANDDAGNSTEESDISDGSDDETSAGSPVAEVSDSEFARLSFPVRIPAEPRYKTIRGHEEQVYCLCDGIDDGRPMVQCEICDEWYHTACIKLKLYKHVYLSHYVCARCCRNNDVSVAQKAGFVEWVLYPVCCLPRCGKPVARRSDNQAVSMFCSLAHAAEFYSGKLQQMPYDARTEVLRDDALLDRRHLKGVLQTLKLRKGLFDRERLAELGRKFPATPEAQWALLGSSEQAAVRNLHKEITKLLTDAKYHVLRLHAAARVRKLASLHYEFVRQSALNRGDSVSVDDESSDDSDAAARKRHKKKKIVKKKVMERTFCGFFPALRLGKDQWQQWVESGTGRQFFGCSQTPGSVVEAAGIDLDAIPLSLADVNVEDVAEFSRARVDLLAHAIEMCTEKNCVVHLEWPDILRDRSLLLVQEVFGQLKKLERRKETILEAGYRRHMVKKLNPQYRTCTVLLDD